MLDKWMNHHIRKTGKTEDHISDSNSYSTVWNTKKHKTGNNSNYSRWMVKVGDCLCCVWWWSMLRAVERSGLNASRWHKACRIFEKVCLREVGREKSWSGQFSCSQAGRPQRNYSQASTRDLLAKLRGHRSCEPMSKINGITFLSPYQFLREGNGNANGTGEGICWRKQHLWRSSHCLFSLNNWALMIKLWLKTP